MYRFVAEHICASLGIGRSRLLTPEETSKLLKVPVKTVYTWVATGIYPKNPAPHVKVGRYVRFDRETVTEWFLKRKMRDNGVVVKMQA
jgi:excisionase family DNA binding protein